MYVHQVRIALLIVLKYGRKYLVAIMDKTNIREIFHYTKCTQTPNGRTKHSM